MLTGFRQVERLPDISYLNEIIQYGKLALQWFRQFCNFLTTNFITKVAQFFVTFWAILENLKI